MLKTALVLIMTLSSSAFAFTQVDSFEFVDCFEKAANEVIQEIKEEGGDTTRICDQVSEEFLFTVKYVYAGEVIGEDMYPASAEHMGEKSLINLYEYMRDEIKCYAPRVKTNGFSVAGDMLNGSTYRRNHKLTKLAFNKMIGAKIWNKFISPNAYKQLKDFDLSYCKE